MSGPVTGLCAPVYGEHQGTDLWRHRRRILSPSPASIPWPSRISARIFWLLSGQFGELVDICISRGQEGSDDPSPIVGELVAVSFGHFFGQPVSAQERQLA